MNEGARTTTIKRVEFRYYFRNARCLEIIYSYSGMVTHLEKSILAEGEFGAEKCPS